jgi:hypothetical protein
MKACIVQQDKTIKVEERPIPSNLKGKDVLFKILAVGESKSPPYVHVCCSSEQADQSCLALQPSQQTPRKPMTIGQTYYLQADHGWTLHSDWKHLAFFSPPGAALGCDFVGQIVELGPDAPQELKGTVRLGFVRGGIKDTNGAFAEYIKQEWDVTAEVPSNITPAQAATAPIPLFTAMQALYLRLGIPYPDQDNSKVKGKWILIWSGSTSVGQ